MSIKTMLNSIEIDYRKANPLSPDKWDKLCDGIEQAYESGAKVKIVLDPNKTPKIKITFKKEKEN